MKKLKITDLDVKKAFKNAGEESKKMLCDLFGSQVELYEKITDRVKSFEDACEVLGISINVPDVSVLPAKHQKAIIADYKRIIIAEALNEGWEPDWNDSSEYKYYPWFYPSAGFAYAYSCNAPSLATAYIGSRLCFKTRELAIYFGKNFTELHKDYILIES